MGRAPLSQVCNRSAAAFPRSPYLSVKRVEILSNVFEPAGSEPFSALGFDLLHVQGGYLTLFNLIQPNLNFLTKTPQLQSTLSVPIFNQPQPLTDDFAGRLISAGADLFFYESLKLPTERNIHKLTVR
jgi:hypothetical protein